MIFCFVRTVKGVRSKASSLLSEVISDDYQDLRCRRTVAPSNLMLPFVPSTESGVGLTDSGNMRRLDSPAV